MVDIVDKAPRINLLELKPFLYLIKYRNKLQNNKIIKISRTIFFTIKLVGKAVTVINSSDKVIKLSTIKIDFFLSTFPFLNKVKNKVNIPLSIKNIPMIVINKNTINSPFLIFKYACRVEIILLNRLYYLTIT